MDILQGTNISHLGKGKIIFKSAMGGDMLVSHKPTIHSHQLIWWLSRIPEKSEYIHPPGANCRYFRDKTNFSSTPQN